MTEKIDIKTRFAEIVSRFCGPRQQTVLGSGLPVLDSSKPNSHDSKSEFLEEKQAVESAHQNATALFNLLTARLDEEDSEKDRRLSKIICAYLDKSVLRKSRRELVESPPDLVRRSAADAGITISMAYILIDFQTELAGRKQELEDQEREFWSGSSRPPNHYARTMALRLARIVAKETGAYPTLGASRDGGHPSTEYGRALESVFQVLGIKANFRRAGKWAIEQLNDDDLMQPTNALAGLSSSRFAASPPPMNVFADLNRDVSKDRGS